LKKNKNIEKKENEAKSLEDKILRTKFVKKEKRSIPKTIRIFFWKNQKESAASRADAAVLARIRLLRPVRHRSRE